MGTFSYVLAGTSKGNELTFGYCCHGAGRNLFRTAAKKVTKHRPVAVIIG